ncbi:MAG: aspartate kinase [Bacteroidales bacterium]
MVIVISAMGKTTNGLEAILEESRNQNGNYLELIENLRKEHLAILDQLFDDADHEIYSVVSELFATVNNAIIKHGAKDYNFIYDQVISIGELVSTCIVSSWLNRNGIENQWVDIRNLLKTDSTYREAEVDLNRSKKNCYKTFNKDLSKIFITQGFIGSDDSGFTTTLGREGSDYTAALLANFLNAENITLWKDVDGIYNADPARFSKIEKINDLDYEEVIELTYYGAKVIHPKTIKPLYDKKIPLYVKSFNSPDQAGTRVSKMESRMLMLPFIIILDEQILFSVSKKDLSFVSEIDLRYLFEQLHLYRVNVNLMQHSAISFSFCVDTPKGKSINELVSKLDEGFNVLYNNNLQLITIRNYTHQLIEELTVNKTILVEQRSRHTAQFIIA